MQNFNSKFKTDLKSRCYQLSLNLIRFIDTLPHRRSSWVIGDQLLRSGMSIGANLIEAKAASSRLEFKKFNEIALKSANESKYWLGLLRDSHLANVQVANNYLVEVTEISNMIAAGIITLKGRR